MTEPIILPQDQVVRLIAQNPREFSLFLGAGASRSSGVPLASEMIEEWRITAHREQAPGEDFNAWCKRQPWHETESEYSELFESLYPNERARQKYVEPKIEAAFPNWGYIYLANIVRNGYLKLIFTTNFDDLVNDALTRFLGYNAVVCAADSDVATINVSTDRAKIVKLHGDYLFKSLKNTKEDLKRLTTNMEKKFGEFAQQCGMLVLGYAGRDESVMALLEKLLSRKGAFPTGVYWGVHDMTEKLPVLLEKLAVAYPKRLILFHCPDFDIFMARMHSEWRLTPPVTILDPIQTAKASFDRLLNQTTEAQLGDITIKEHHDHLLKELDGSIARATDPSVLDFFEAQIALGQRDYRTALARIGKYAEHHPDDAKALTVWGSALAIQAEEEGSEILLNEAVSKWKEACRSDPKWVPAHRCLAGHFYMRHQFLEAIAEIEALLALTPKDLSVRRALAQLYASVSRFKEARQILDELLDQDPENPDLYMMRWSVLEQSGLTREAMEDIQRAVRFATANAWIRIILAFELAKIGKVEQASAEFNQAIQLEPKNANFRIQAAAFFYMNNQPYQALQHLETAVQLAQDSAEAKGWLAQVYGSIGRLEDAQREIELALQIDGEDPRLLTTAGDIFTISNRLDLAESYLLKAIGKDPNFIPAKGVMAKFYWFSGREQKYKDLMQKIAQSNPDVASQILQQLRALYQQGISPQTPPGQWLAGWFQASGVAPQHTLTSERNSKDPLFRKDGMVFRPRR